MSKIDVQEIVVDGETYVKRSSLCAAPVGPRAVVVVDRGWIFAGDVTEENGRIFLDNAVWVFGWQSIGFAAVVENPKQANVDIRLLKTRVNIPQASEVFRLPVAANWGL